ncbi:MAG: tetratricopeptide repeat protein [Nitrospirales bacterium]|nr:tetratricopeptide repeat protein [Nitrospirales bacterium]
MAFKIKDLQDESTKAEVQFLSRMERGWLFAEQHRTAIIASLLLLSALGIGIGVMVWLEQEKETAAWELQHRATQLYIDRPLDQPETADKNLTEAIQLYQTILKDYPRSSSAELAGYFIGNAFVDQKNFDGALQAYQNQIQRYGKNETLLGLVYQRLGYLHLLQGNQQQTKEAFLKILTIPGALNKDQVLFDLAKLEEKDSNHEKALSYYKDLLNQHPQSPLAGEASIRTKALDKTEDEETPLPSSDAETPQKDTTSKETSSTNKES